MHNILKQNIHIHRKGIFSITNNSSTKEAGAIPQKTNKCPCSTHSNLNDLNHM